MNPESIFYIYLDRTTDGRVFYVGKGKEDRLRNVSNRNNRWKNIAAKYGHTRDVILGTSDEEFAFEMEKALITEHKTFESKWAKGEGWGANFTDGGEGLAGRTGELNAMYGMKGELSPRFGKKHTEEAKQKLRNKMSGENNHMFGKTGEESARWRQSPSEETRKKLSESFTGEKNHQYGKTGEFSPNFGKIHSEITKNKMSQSRIDLITNDTENSLTKLKADQVISIRNKYKEGKLTQQELANEYGVSRRCIGKIVKGEMWSHLISDENPISLPITKIKRDSKGENSSRAILSEAKVLEIRAKHLTGNSNVELSKEYSVSRKCINNIVNGKSWSHLPYPTTDKVA